MPRQRTRLAASARPIRVAFASRFIPASRSMIFCSLSRFSTIDCRGGSCGSVATQSCCTLWPSGGSAAIRSIMRRPNTIASDSELLPSRFPPCRHFAAGKQPFHRCLPMQIRLDAAHHVVCRRCNRDPVRGQIEPKLLTEVVDGWKAAFDEFFRFMCNINVDKRRLRCFHLIENSSRYNIARS